MNEYWFEIEYIDPLNLASTRIKAVGFKFAHNLQDEAPELVFYGKDSQPVFTHQGLPNIIKSIHFIKEEVSENELLSPGVIIKNVYGHAEHAATSDNIKPTTTGTDDQVLPF